MNEIWANRLVAGTQEWANMPTSRQTGVKAVLKDRVTDNVITKETYAEITGEEYAE